MNYSKIYNDLIYRAKNRIYDGFTESHHIIPRCMQGSNDIANIAELTPEEHFLAHQLLINIYPNEPKLVLAARYMCYDSNGKRINNKMFGWIRKKHAESMSKLNKGRIVSPELAKRRGDSQKGKIGPMKDKTHSAETKQKMSDSAIGKSKPPRTITHTKNHADSIRGVPRSEETKQKIKESTKGKSFEERYGPEEARIRREKLKKSWELRKLNNIFQESVRQEYLHPVPIDPSK